MLNGVPATDVEDVRKPQISFRHSIVGKDTKYFKKLSPRFFGILECFFNVLARRKQGETYETGR